MDAAPQFPPTHYSDDDKHLSDVKSGDHFIIEDLLDFPNDNTLGVAADGGLEVEITGGSTDTSTITLIDTSCNSFSLSEPRFSPNPDTAGHFSGDLFPAMIIIAGHQRVSSNVLFGEDLVESILSIFITAAILNFLRAILDIVLSYNSWIEEPEIYSDTPVSPKICSCSILACSHASNIFEICSKSKRDNKEIYGAFKLAY